MGYSKAQKARTHKRIVAIASKRFREKGLAGFGIAELMKEAGLTVGGFYKHFESRDNLVSEAVNSAFGGWKRRVDAAKSIGPPVSYEKLIDDYLNEVHRDNPGTGCAFSALAPEIARSDADPCAYLRTGPERHSVDCRSPSSQRQAYGKIESDFDFQCARRGDGSGARGIGRGAFARDPEDGSRASEEFSLRPPGG